ncbi:MAG: hypothetical protein ACRYHQ_24645 [Janthinobacterium lividum]
MRSTQQKVPPLPVQTTMPLDDRNLHGMTMVEREAAVGALGRLLLEAAGISAGESRDDNG